MNVRAAIGLAGAHFAGQQADAVMIDQELETRLDLVPYLRKQTTAWASRLSLNGVFLKPKKAPTMAGSSSSFFSLSRSTKLMPVVSAGLELGVRESGGWHRRGLACSRA